MPRYDARPEALKPSAELLAPDPPDILMNRPLHWDPETLWQTLEPLAPGLSVEMLPETGSTSTALLERSRRGLTEPCLLLPSARPPGAAGSAAPGGRMRRPAAR